jgi:hypothetical protein
MIEWSDQKVEESEVGFIAPVELESAKKIPEMSSSAVWPKIIFTRPRAEGQASLNFGLPA